MAQPKAQRPLLIGVTTCHGQADWIYQNSRRYLDVLHSYGAQTVVLVPDAPAVLPDGRSFTPDEQGRLPEEVLPLLDGLILSGGGDVHPKHFGQELAGAEPEEIDPARDELELALARQALAQDLPLFGICRGCQVLNVAAGGGMVQHFDGHRPHEDGSTRYHAVRVAPASRLRDMVCVDALPVNSFHHQGLDAPTLSPLFTAVAYAEDDPWLVEAYESAEHRWVLGVQWHPERLWELDPAHKGIWDSFVSACAGSSRS